jgi:photosystem II stability/assembly factor-like uncharacterized protein
MRIETLAAVCVSLLPLDSGAAPSTCSPASGTGVDPRRELQIDGRITELSLSPTGRIWLATATGRTYLADQIGADWQQGTLLLGSPKRWSGISIGRISFFDANTAIATGHIGSTQHGPKDTLYRTTDAGLTWQPVSFGSGEWIYDVFTNDAGEAWMGGSAGSFLHSSDAGRTWEARAAPFDGSSRTHRIVMTSRTTGYVGALQDAIRTTTDGGSTWRDLPTPFQQGKNPKREHGQGDHRIEKLAVAAGLLLVEQDGRVFRSAPDRIDWTPFLEPELISFEVDRSTGRLVGITSDLRLVEFDASLKATPLSSEPLHARPIDLKSVNGAVTVLDENNGLYRVAGGRLEFGYPLTSAGPATPMTSVRKRGDVLWGVTHNHIYNSRDGGQSWCRVGQVFFDIDGFAVKDDDRILLWDGHGTNALFDRRSGQAKAVAGLREDDVIDVLTLPGLWVAYGGRQFETAQRVEVARTFAAGEFRGSRENGFVYVSRDDGDTWVRIDEWREGGVARVFLAPDGHMLLLSYLGSVRRLDRSEAAYRATNLIVADDRNRDRVPHVERAEAFYFSDDRTGYIGGWIHHLGQRRFKTTDGGKTWKPTAEAEFPYRLLLPGRGAYVATDLRQVVVLRADAAEPLAAASRLLAEANGHVSDLSFDDSGRILLEVSSDELGYENRVTKWFSLPMP